MKKNIKEFLKTVRNKMLTLGLTVSGLGTASAVEANTNANSSDANAPKTESASFDYKKTSLNVAEYKRAVLMLILPSVHRIIWAGFLNPA